MEEIEKERLLRGYPTLWEGGTFLSFLTRLVDTDLAKELVAKTGRYNDFDPEKVKATMDRLRGKISGYYLGRESSPVIYVILPYWTHQREYSKEVEGKRISDAERTSLKKEVIEEFEKAKADECWQDTDERIRARWD